MSILIQEILINKFQVTISKELTTKHTVILSDKLYKRLTNKKISKKKLIEYSFEFLLAREANTSISSFFELQLISKYFPEYESEIKKYLQK